MTRNGFDHLTITLPRTSRRQFLKATGGFVALAGAAGILEACQALPGGAATARPITNTSFQLRWLKDTGFAGFFAAVEKGYYTEEGLNVDIIAGGPNIDVQQVVAGGGVPLGEGITDRIIRGRVEQDVPFVVFGAIYQTPPSTFMAFAEKNIRTPQDFAGKRLATTPEGVPLVRAMLRANGIDENSVEFVMAGFDPSPLINDEADIYQGFRTDQGITLELAGHEMTYVTYGEMGYPMYDGPIFATRQTLEQDEDLAVRFLRASIKGWEYNEANPAEVVDLVVDKYGVEGLNREAELAENLAQIPMLKSEVTEAEGLFAMTEQRWQDTIDFLVDAGELSHSIPASDIMTTAIHEKAMGDRTKLL